MILVGFEIEGKGIKAHVRPSDHVNGGKMHFHKDRVFKNLVGQIEAEDITEKSEAIANRTVLTAKRVVRREVKYDILLAQLGLNAEAIHVSLSVFEEAPCGGGACEREEAFLEAETRDFI